MERNLNDQINRIKNIFEYQYRFYNEADEPAEDELPEPIDDVPGDEPDMVQEPAPVADVPQPQTEPAPNTQEMPPQNDMGMEEPSAETGQDEYIDITQLVSTNTEIKDKLENLSLKIDSTVPRFTQIFSTIGQMETSLNNMSDALKQIDALRQQVELMRPPTEEERRKAVAKDSYPFNVTFDDYHNNRAIKTQTELEKRPNKLTLLDVLNDYNEQDVKSSFNPTKNNIFNDKTNNYYRV
jgi:hypothetical protein